MGRRGKRCVTQRAAGAGLLLFKAGGGMTRMWGGPGVTKDSRCRFSSERDAGDGIFGQDSRGRECSGQGINSDTVSWLS